GDTLYYSLKQYDGNYIVSTPVSELFDTPTPPDSLYKWKIADELTRQETALAAKKAAGLPIYEYETRSKDTNTENTTLTPTYTDSLTLAQALAAVTADPDSVQISEPTRYRKAGHIFNIHSWAPVYFNVDNIMNMSYDKYYSLASLGLAAISQNQLGTAITQFGYSAHQDPYNWHHHWKNSGHATFTYTGWYPVFEVSVDFNDRNAIDYRYREQDVYNAETGIGTRTLYGGEYRLRGANKPYVTGYVSVYVPFNFTRGGWSTGLIPQLTYSLGNDSFTKITSTMPAIPDPDNLVSTSKKVVIMQRLTASVRGYTMRPTADSGVYPRWGVGAQIGVSLRPGLTEYYSPAGFLYVYGYVPGISRTQGLNLSFRVQAKLDGDSWFGD
ncbi:MAG: hypothetical protein LUC24_05845, partial [Bacteroidales bacterium]|nr:hypothetical protein [Bacteroidales bacterium]